MNRFVFCIKTGRGITFGTIKANDGRHAREGIELIYNNAGDKILKLEMFGLNGDIVQIEEFKQ